MLLLKLLSENDMYGYQMTTELKKRSNGSFTILEGSMYPILYRLADSGCVSCHEEKVGKRQTRIYYHIEQAGTERLHDMEAEYHNSIQVIEFLLKSTQGDIYGMDNA